MCLSDEDGAHYLIAIAASIIIIKRLGHGDNVIIRIVGVPTIA